MSLAQNWDGPVTDTHDTEKYPLGTLRLDATTGKWYRYVKLVDLDGAAYKMAYAASATTWDVTIDASGGSAIANLRAVGMLQGTVDISEAAYCWVQCSGICTFTAGSAAIIAGDFLKPDTAENGDLEEATAGTDENVCAIALATVADNETGLCMLYNMP